MEAEARRILREALEAHTLPPEINLYDRIRARIESFGGVEIDLPKRESAYEPPTFE